MDQEQTCKKCVREAGKEWDSTSDSDLCEGICPKERNDERSICQKTGKKLQMTGKVHLVM